MSKISVYPQGQKIKDRLVPASVPNGQMEFATYLGYIKDGKWEDVVLDVRAGRVDKLAAPGVTISGTFSRREAKGLMAEADRLLKEAASLDPVKTSAPKKTTKKAKNTKVEA